MPINYDLLPRRWEPIPGVGEPVKDGGSSRRPIWESRLPRDLSFIRRFDPFFGMTYNESHLIDFHRCNANVDYLGHRSDGTIGHMKQRWQAIADGLTSDLFTVEKIDIVAFLGQFHTASTAQLASYLGLSINETEHHLMRLFAHGIVCRSEMDWLKNDPQMNRLGHLWRIAYGAGTGKLVEQWLNELNDFEYLMVTSGRDISRGVSGSAGLYTHRHNVQMTELALRAFETCPGVAGILGERPSGIENIVDTSRYVVRGNVADAALVGADGRIILFELTAAKIVGNTIIDKARAWANAIALSPDLDVYVVFVNTNPIHDRSTYRRRVMYGVLDSEADFRNPAVSLKKAQQRIFVADTKTLWFPSTNTVYEAFKTMNVYNPFYDAIYTLLPPDMKWRVRPETLSARASLSTPAWVTNDIKYAADGVPRGRLPAPYKRKYSRLR